MQVIHQFYEFLFRFCQSRIKFLLFADRAYSPPLFPKVTAMLQVHNTTRYRFCLLTL